MILMRVCRSLLILVLVVFVGSYLFYLRTGSFPISTNTFYRGSVSNGGSADLRRLSEMPSLNSVEPPADMKTIQQWQDESGHWNFSNQKNNH